MNIYFNSWLSITYWMFWSLLCWLWLVIMATLLNLATCNDNQFNQLDQQCSFKTWYSIYVTFRLLLWLFFHHLLYFSDIFNCLPLCSTIPKVWNEFTSTSTWCWVNGNLNFWVKWTNLIYHICLSFILLNWFKQC